MSKDQISVNIKPGEIVRALASKLQNDLTRLQIAIIKENKHDIGTCLEAAINRSSELTERLNESANVVPFQ